MGGIYQPTKPQVVAEHPFYKLSLIPVVVFLLSTLAWFGNYLVEGMEKKLDLQYQAQQTGLEKINDNVTGIAVNRNGIDANKDDIKTLGETDGRIWRQLQTKADK